MAWEDIVQAASHPAASDLSASQYCFVDLDSSANLVVASDGGRSIGVLQDKPNAAGRAGSVCRAGDRTKVKFGGVVAKGANVASDGTGRAVTAGTGDKILGVNLDQTGAANEIGTILFQPVGVS